MGKVKINNRKPNILFIVIDSARLDHLSVYGYHKQTSPFLERIANDFVIYFNANTPAAWTRPAMTSIFTGLYPEQYGFFDEKYLGPEMPIISEILKYNGYRSILLSNNAYMSPATGFDRSADHFYYINSKNFYQVLDKTVI
ncbi:MAG: sulfatase-like hydrolase/transferase, partial [Nitrospiraceae bacterium]